MKLLITGGSGFLAGRLTGQLSKSELYELVLASRKPNAGLEEVRNFNSFAIDWNSNDSLQQMTTGVETIVHTAGMNASDCARNPQGAFLFNSYKTAELVNAAIKNKVKRIIYISTAHVYGAPLNGIIDEFTPNLCLHPYAASQLIAENSIRSAHNQGLLEGVVLRLSNAFGPPISSKVDCWGLLINDLCKQAVISGELTVNGSGQEQRNFIAMTNVCRAIDHFISLPEFELNNGVFNIGSNWNATVKEVVDKIIHRYCLLSGDTIEATYLGQPSSGSDQKFTYLHNKACLTGLNLDCNIDSEIDDLLRYCMSTFNE